MTLFIEIIYVFAVVVLILVVLLQAGRGGGMGTALGGGASQGVFGGGGGADFLAKLTQALATTFMVCAVYLAYASAHSGSDRLKDESEKRAKEERLVDDDEDVNYEMAGEGVPQELPSAAAAPAPPTSADSVQPRGTPVPDEAPPADPGLDEWLEGDPADAPADAPAQDPAPAPVAPPAQDEPTPAEPE